MLDLADDVGAGLAREIAELAERVALVVDGLGQADGGEDRGLGFDLDVLAFAGFGHGRW